jgi:hypothetical protein
VTADSERIAVELDDSGFDSGVEAETITQPEIVGGPFEPDDRIRSPFDPEKSMSRPGI